MSKKELAVAETRQANDMLQIISQAVSNNIPVESLERLLAVKERLDAENARQAFIRAMANFQNDCPIIAKTKQGNGYKYAPLDAIVSQVKPILARNGLTYRIESSDEGESITATCVITHEFGHSERSSFSAKTDAIISKAGNKVRSSAQDTATANTFAKRYAFCNALGIMTGDEDTDADKKADNIDGLFDGCKTADEVRGTFAKLPPKQRNDGRVTMMAKDKIASLAI